MGTTATCRPVGQTREGSSQAQLWLRGYSLPGVVPGRRGRGAVTVGLVPTGGLVTMPMTTRDGGVATATVMW